MISNRELPSNVQIECDLTTTIAQRQEIRSPSSGEKNELSKDTELVVSDSRTPQYFKVLNDSDCNDLFLKIETLGEGTYGKVHKVRCKTTGKSYAIKKCILNHTDEGVQQFVLREHANLSTISACPNIVRFYGTIMTPTCARLVFDYFDTTLADFLFTQRKASLASQKPWDPHQMKALMWQLASAVNFSHTHGIMHRDIKPSNILMKPSTDFLALADFGLSRRFYLPERAYSPDICTLWYRAPELLLGQDCEYTMAIDIWSMGCVFMEILTCNPCVLGDDWSDQLRDIFDLCGTPDKFRLAKLCKGSKDIIVTQRDRMFAPIFLERTDYPVCRAISAKDMCLLYDLLTKMLEVCPEDRISSEEILEHPLFDSLSQRTWDDEKSSAHQQPQLLYSEIAKNMQSPKAILISYISKVEEERVKRLQTQLAIVDRPYVESIIKRYFLMQRPLLPSGFMEHYQNINHQMRTILLAWLNDVHLKFKLVGETWFRCIQLLDSFLWRNKQQISRERLQLVGTTSLWIADKLEEIHPCICSDYVFMCANAYQLSDFIEMEKEILSCVEPFDMNGPLLIDFLREYATGTQIVNGYTTYSIAKYITELIQTCSFNSLMKGGYTPADLAIGSLVYATRVERFIKSNIEHSTSRPSDSPVTPHDDDAVVRAAAKKTGYSVQKIKNLAEFMHSEASWCLTNSHRSSNFIESATTIERKYSSKKLSKASKLLREYLIRTQTPKSNVTEVVTNSPKLDTSVLIDCP